MSRLTTSQTHATTKVSKPTGFLRRNLGVFVVLGVVLALAGPAAEATNGNPVLLGFPNYATNSTSATTTAGYGLEGVTYAADSSYAGVYGSNEGGGNGVYGHTSSSTASGVYGENNAGGYGVAGRATNGGVAVLADTADGTGTALVTTGTLRFQNRSGIATIASGHKSKTVTLAGVTATSMVTATVQRTGGYFVQAAVPAAGSFTVYINKAPVSPATVKVAYLVLD